MRRSAGRITAVLVIAGLLSLLALSMSACGGSSFAYTGAWASEKSGIPQLLIEPDGSQWSVKDTAGQTFTYAAKDGGLVCTSAAPETLTPSGDKLIAKDPASMGAYQQTLVRVDKVPSPWPSSP